MNLTITITEQALDNLRRALALTQKEHNLAIEGQCTERVNRIVVARRALGLPTGTDCIERGYKPDYIPE